MKRSRYLPTPAAPKKRLSSAAARRVRLSLPMNIRVRLGRCAAHLGLPADKFIAQLLHSGIESVEEEITFVGKDLRRLRTLRAQRKANRRLYGALKSRHAERSNLKRKGCGS